MSSVAEPTDFLGILRAFYIRTDRPSFVHSFRNAERVARSRDIDVPSPIVARRALIASITREDEAVLRGGQALREAGL